MKLSCRKSSVQLDFVEAKKGSRSFKTAVNQACVKCDVHYSLFVRAQIAEGVVLSPKCFTK